MDDFKSLGEQLQAIYNAGKSGTARVVDPRLLITASAPSGASEQIPSDGGFLLRDTYADGILQKIYSTGEIASRVNRKEAALGSRTMKLPSIDETNRGAGSRFGGISSFWAPEVGSVASSKPKFKLLELHDHKVTALVYVTNQLLADAPMLGDFLANEVVASELRFRLEDAIVGGGGAGQPLGILNSTAKITVSKESSQATATIVENNIANMWSRFWAPSRKNAVWLINQDSDPQLDMIPAGPNALRYAQPGVSGAPFAFLKGCPVIPVEYCPTLGTEGDIILVDLSQYLTVDKGAMLTDTSIHVRFLEDEMAFRFTYLVDGQPLWSSALTPRNGTATQSAFVTLQTRS